MKSQTVWMFVYMVMSMSSIIINKHVLTDLHFTYPTIYQSWQMCVVAILLILLHLLGVVYVQITSLSTITMWIPAIFLFTCSIYSGSVALSKLSVLNFGFIQQILAHCFIVMSDLLSNGLRSSKQQIFALISGLLSMIIVMMLDQDFSVNTYQWIFLHCGSIGAYSHYAMHVSRTDMKEIDKMMINSVGSILLLLLFGYMTGEIITVQEFPMLFERHFHFGCIFSGIFGALVILSYSQLLLLTTVRKVRFYNVCTMLLTCLISCFVFSISLTRVMVLVTALGFSNVIVLAYWLSEQESSKDNVLSEKINEPRQFKAPMHL